MLLLLNTTCVDVSSRALKAYDLEMVY